MPKISDHLFATLDTETTGADPKINTPIEIAIAKIENWKTQKPISWLINPQTPIPPEASAVHHLVDEDVQNERTLIEVLPEVEHELQNCIIIAHNAPFDRSMLPVLDSWRWLCTLRLAKHIWAKGTLNAWGQPLTSHQQQVIRYWLKLKIDTMGLAAHRAAADILVTAELFKELVKAYLQQGGEDDLDSLFELIDSPIHISTMPFGKYANTPMEFVPTEYFEFLIKNKGNKTIDPDLEASIYYQLERRKAKIILATRIMPDSTEQVPQFSLKS